MKVGCSDPRPARACPPEARAPAPDPRTPWPADPGWVAAGGVTELLASLRDAPRRRSVIRWCRRCAPQPPANGCQASGLDGDHHSGCVSVGTRPPTTAKAGATVARTTPAPTKSDLHAHCALPASNRTKTTDGADTAKGIAPASGAQ